MKHFYNKYFYFLLFLLHAETNIHAQLNDYGPTVYPIEEVRAVWLTTVKSLDWPKTKATSPASIERQKRELTDILDRLHQANLNTVLFQTRVRGAVLYPSKLEPWDDCLTGTFGKNPGYDPLLFAIDECHKRGMELHAWVVAIPIGNVQKQKGFGNQSVWKKHPELCKQVGSDIFMMPSKEGTADYLASICREIVENYDVDGITLDYIRYPESFYNYNDGCSAQQKRDNITRIVRRIHDVVKPIRPWVKLSSSPIGKYRSLRRYSAGGWNCYDGVYQEAQEWLRDNIQDMLFPMMYFLGNNFYPFLYDWADHRYGHPIAAGLGIYFLDPSEGKWTLNDVRAQMRATRESGLGGIAFFRSNFFTRNVKGLYDSTCNEFYPYPALTPRMTWSEDTVPPAAPTRLRHTNNHLEWTDTSAVSSAKYDYTYYNIYGADVYPVDISNAENIVRMRVRDQHIDLGSNERIKRYYAVCACDRFGNQSPAVQETVNTSLPDFSKAWNPLSRLDADGNRIDDRLEGLKSGKRPLRSKKGFFSFFRKYKF